MTFEDFFEEWRSGSPEIVAKTSGSTGEPKIIRLPKPFVRESAERTNSFFNITSESRLHSCVAADFIGGKMMAVRSDVAGCAFSYESPSNRPLGMLRRDDCLSLVAVVPSQMVHILERLPDMPRVGAYLIGGSPLNSVLRAQIISSGVNAYESYGMTETASHIALRRVVPGEEWFSALPGVRVGADSRGCLVISFDSGGEVVTNDLALLQSDREFKILGRADNVIITGGKKLNPVELENAISPLIRSEFVVASVPDVKWGRKVVLRIEGEPWCAPEELISAIKNEVEPWMAPKEVLWVDKLPRTASGKLKRE